MADNPIDPGNARDQRPILNNWNSNEFGLQPRNLLEDVLHNFIKSFSYNFIWDRVNSIWRAMSSDNAGNLKVTNGTQFNVSPLITSVGIDNTEQSFLDYNPQRRYFTVYNNTPGAGYPTETLSLSYPNPANSDSIKIPVGYLYLDDTWQGSIIISKPTGINTQTVTIVEYE